MQKRIIIYIVSGMIAAMVVYIYIGIYIAEKETDTFVPPAENQKIDLDERLQNAGAMSEDDRLKMVDKLNNAGL